MGCIDLPNPTQGTSLGGAGQEHLGLVLYESIEELLDEFNSMASCVFDESLAHCQKWWPKWHPSSMAGAQIIQID
jgi:hypothetical protein